MPAPSRRNSKWLKRYGPWALVTGASDGIGREVARELAGRGLNLVLVARRVERLEALAAELRSGHGIEARVLVADLSISEQVQRVADQTANLDIGLLIASAGFGTAGRFLETRLDDELSMLDVNCRAVLAQTKIFAERFAKRGSGGIVLFSSIVAFQGVPNAASYAATKAYNQTLAEGLRTELAPHGIDVLACAPGPVDTGFAARSNLNQSGAKPQIVARETIDAIGRMTTVRPGFMSKFLIGSLAMLPRFGRTFIMGNIMGGMAKHRYAAKRQAR